MSATHEPLASLLIERFKSARRTLRITQRTAGKILSVGQKQISDYELGNPPPTEEQVQNLEERVAEQRLALEALAPVAGRGALESVDGVPRLLSDDDYLRHIGEFVAQWERWDNSFIRTDRCDFFFFGPERLPVFGEARFQALWSVNLRKRVSYNLFWLLDDCSREELQQAYLTLKRIELAAAGATSHLHVWGVLITGETSENKDTRALYQKFRDGCTQSSVLQMERLVNLNSETQGRQEWIKAVRLGGLEPLMVGRIRIDFEDGGALPEAIVPPESFASSREKDVALKQNGAKATGWLFLGQDETNKLVEGVDKMLRSVLLSEKEV